MLSRNTVLSSSDSGNKVTFSAGQKKVFVTYPSEKSVNFDVSGNISVSSAVITDVGYPSADSDAATKLYVDNMTSAALHIHEAVVLTTPADSGRNDNYNNGTAGVSATLTATANGTLVIDSTVAQAAQRVLIKDCDAQAENGIYVVTTVGTASTPYVMTRAADADTYGEGGSDSLDLGSYFFTTGGTTQKGAAYVCNTPGVIVFGSTAITFAEFSQAQVYSAGNGISITLGSIALNTPVTVASGGTGLTTSPTNGQLLIGNGSNYTLSTLTAGSGVSITNSAGSITLSATGLGGTVTAVTATGPLASSGGTTPDISIANSTGTGSVVLDQGATISSATITAAVSASITTITGTSANITTVTGTTAGFSSANITQLGSTSATIATLSGTNVTYSSGTVSQLAATSATIASVSGTNATYSNGNFTSATVTTVSGTTATYTSATVTNLALTSLTLSNLSIASATITSGNLNFSSTAQRITGDFSNATESSRLAFQSSTTNGGTRVNILTNGTGTASSLDVFGVNDPTNAAVMRVRQSGTESQLLASITGTGTYLPMTFYTGGSERVRIDTSGNVLIGRTTQIGTEKLSVQGATLGGTAGNTSYSMTLYTPDVSNTTRLNFFDYRLANGTSHATSQNRIQRRVDSTEMGYLGFDSSYTRIGWGTTDALYLNDSNNVGIGSLPVSNVRLAVGAGNRIANSFGNLYVYTTDTATTNFGGQITVGGSYTGTTNAPFAGFAGRWEGTGVQGYAQFNVLDPSGNLTERMRIDSSGNVGIGTTNTTTFGAKLYVSSAGSAQASMMVWNPGIGSGQVGVAAASSNLKVYNTYSTGTLAGGVGIDIDQNGNVGIGTSTPLRKLDISGGGFAFTESGGASRNIHWGDTTNIYPVTIGGNATTGNCFLTFNTNTFGNSASERMRIDSLGNVGIGTNAPTNFGGTNLNVTAANSTVYASQLWTSGAYVMQALVQESGAVMSVGSRSNHKFDICTNDTTRISITNTGNVQINTSLGVGTAGSGTTGEIRATNNITAYYSDARLKDFKGKIGDALNKVSQLNGYYYTENQKAEEFGYNNKELQVGVSAQEVKAVLPEVVTPAPFDLIKDEDGKDISKSGDNYMTVRYEKLVPLLIEAIKELKAEVEALKAAK
jgi:hypothetical protein